MVVEFTIYSVKLFYKTQVLNRINMCVGTNGEWGR